MTDGAGTGTATGVLGRVRRSVASDEQLLSRARQGDVPCFEELYRRHHSAVFGYCLVRLNDRHAAEDAAQEVFARAAMASGQPIERVTSWLFTIARNVLVDATRRRKHDPALLDLEALVDAADHAPAEAAFSAMDTAPNVFIALRRLPARERRALVLREFQDKTSADIAVELKTRPANVDVIVSRARTAFGRAYAEVADMPFACRQTTEVIYRELGSGVTEQQRDSMQAHLATCPRCMAEYRRAHAPRYLGALAPILWPAMRLPNPGTFLARLRANAEPATLLLDRASSAGWSMAIRATLALAIVGTALTPQIAEQAAGPPPAAPGADVGITALSETRTERLPTKIDLAPTGVTGAATAATHDAAATAGMHAEAHPMEYTMPSDRTWVTDSHTMPEAVGVKMEPTHLPDMVPMHTTPEMHEPTHTP